MRFPHLFTIYCASLLFSPWVLAQNALKSAIGADGSKDASVEMPVTPEASVSNLIKQVDGELARLSTATNLLSKTEIAYQRAKLNEIRKVAGERREVLRQLSTTVSPETDTDLPPLPAPDKPVSLMYADQLRGILRARKATQATYHEIVETSVQESDYARKQLQNRQQELRALKELSKPSPAQQESIQHLPIEIRLQEQVSELQQLRLKAVRHDETRVNNTIAVVEQQLASARKRVRFSEAAFQDIQVQLDQRAASLQRQLDDLQLKLRAAEAAPPNAQTIDEIRVLRHLAEFTDERLQRVPEDRTAWQHRYDLFNTKPPASQRYDWENDAKKQVARLERLVRVKEIRRDELKQQLLNATSAADDADENSSESVEARLILGVEGALTSLRRSLDLEHNLLADCAMLSASAPINQAWSRLTSGLVKFWHFEITSIDERPVTIRKIVLALLLLILGIRFVRWLSHKLIRRILKTARVDENTTIAISTLGFYALAVLVFVIALGFAGIPLTLFTLLGGALAIGLGFGSQNIINNFISGLILLLERPIRVNDMVDVGGTNGKVIRVGLRCTQVRTFNNIDIMVPNSSFLESNVINWTLTDDRARGELFIGVAYGSATDRVKALMLKAAKEHPKILKDPAPEVMFMDFGDNSLLFRMYIWVHMRSPSDRDRVLSDLRFRVDELFREEELVIAFPQRDVHLDTTRPLEIHMVEKGNAPS